LHSGIHCIALNDNENRDINAKIMTQQQAIESLSFEDALGELETIVRSLEKGETALENSISAYERGIALKKHCESKLRDAQAKIEKITMAQDGSISTEPLDADNE
jgi:exodeoxyribonuclease VII small subunit